MDELKMGDKVEVYFKNTWLGRIFIKLGIDNSVICVEPSWEECFNEGNTFDVCRYDRWRKVKPVTYRAYREEEVYSILGKAVKDKETSDASLITSVNKHSENVTLDGVLVSVRDLFLSYTFLDGSVCGVKEE